MIALICSYGVYDKELRNSIEMEGLNEYINGIIDYFDKNRDFSDIIICGGYTNLNSEFSESETFRNILYKKFEERNIKINLKIENTSFITYENFIFGILSLRTRNIENILIIADKYREYKIKIESSLIFNPVGINLNYLFLDRRDSHPNSNFEKQSFEILPKDLQNKSFMKLVDFFHEAMREVNEFKRKFN